MMGVGAASSGRHPGSCLTPHLPMSSLPPPNFPCPASKKMSGSAVSTPISAVKLSQCHIPQHRISLKRQNTQHCAQQRTKTTKKLHCCSSTMTIDCSTLRAWGILDQECTGQVHYVPLQFKGSQITLQGSNKNNNHKKT